MKLRLLFLSLLLGFVVQLSAQTGIRELTAGKKIADCSNMTLQEQNELQIRMRNEYSGSASTGISSGQGTSQQRSGTSARGTNVTGTFTTLASCPMNLTCFTVDPTTGYFYGQGDQGSINYYRYDASSNTWTTLAPCPVSSGNNGGATCLDGKIYNSYCSNNSIAIYTIATNTWTSIASGMQTGDICNDGTDIYISGNEVFKKYVVSSGTWVGLTGTACQPWGGLQYKNGYIYLHTGDGSVGFKRYQVSTNTWTDLTNVPGGAVLGSAIYDAYYYCQGDYGGNNLYSYDLGAQTWNNTLTLPFTTNDAAIVTYGNSLYIVQGEAGRGFTKFTPNNPILTGVESTILPYSLGDPDVNITQTLTATQNSGTNWVSATISITANFVAGKDVLSFVNANGITGSYNASTGVMTLSGTASIANYQAALRSVKFANTDVSSSNATRTIAFVAYNGTQYSNTTVRSIGIPGPPVITTTGVTGITAASATSGGVVTDDGFYTVTARGICWNTTGSPTPSDSHTTNGSGLGSFTSTMTGLTDQTTYYVRAYATNSMGIGYGEALSFLAQTSACIPAVSTNPCIMYISNVTTTGGISNFNNPSTCSATSYTDYSSTKKVSQASGNSVTMSFTSLVYPMDYAVWIDYNKDAVYSSSERVIAFGNGSMNVSASFTVPASIAEGTYRMRVRGEYHNSGVPTDPCSTLQYGETEDYALVVVMPPPANPTSITASPATICNGSSSQLTANGADGTVYWYTESCGGTQIGIANPVTVSPTANTTYFARNYKNGKFSDGCASAEVIVNPVTVPGTITGTNTITYGSSTGTLTLNGYTGDIQYWEKKFNSGSWTTVANTSNTFSEVPNAAGIWYYRAAVKSGICPEEYSGEFVVTVNKANILVTASAGQSKVYGESDPAFTYTYTPELASGDSFTGALSRVAGENVGSYAYTLGTLTAGSPVGGVAGANYNLTLAATPEFTIHVKSVLVTANAGQSKVYGESDPTFTYTYTPALVSGDAFTGALSRVAGENVGSYAYTMGTLTAGSPVGGVAGVNYDLSLSVTPEFTITTKPVLVTANAGQSKIYGESDPVFTYTFTPALASGDSFTGALSRVAGENVGSYAYTLGTLTAGPSVGGVAGANYDLTIAETPEFTISMKSVLVTANAGQSKIYGESDPVFTYTFTPALISGDSFTGALSRVSGENVGSYAYTLGTLTAGSPVGGVAGANYDLTLAATPEFTINIKSLLVTANAGQSKVYGESDPTFTYTCSPALISGDSFGGALNRMPGENVGSYQYTLGNLTAGSNGGANYMLTLASTPVFTVNIKSILITAKASQSKEYGGVDPVFKYTCSPALVSGDSFTGALSRNDGEDAGTYAYTLGSLSAGSNYNLSLAPTPEFTINQKAILLIVDEGQYKIYNEADPEFTYFYFPGLVTGDYFTGSLERAPGENVGQYHYNLGDLRIVTPETSVENYHLTLYASDAFSIIGKSILITANPGQSKVYGETDPEFTYTYTPGLVAGDSFTGALGRVAGENAGTYAYSLGNLTAGPNYVYTVATSTTFNIGVKSVFITANPGQSKVYGDNDPNISYTYTPGLVLGDSFSGALGRESGEDVGTYAYTLGTLAAGGNAGSNYSLTLSTTPEFTINQKQLLILVNAGQSKIYGDPDPVFTYTYFPTLVSGDSFTGALSRVAGENVGSYAYTLGTLTAGPTVGGVAGANYDLTLAATPEFTISVKSVLVTANAGQSKVYGESDPTFTYTYTPELVSGDSFSGALNRVAGENVGSYAYTLGTLTAGPTVGG
ncbi:MAG: MBG domain-containing protein, partial [Lentimicrobiaceae bacterium]